MRVLLDTHVLIALTNGPLASTYPKIAATIEQTNVEVWASVTSVWEIAIKARLGKLKLGLKVSDLASFCMRSQIKILPIDQRHVVADVVPQPRTRDPFDYLLLAQCQVETLRLVTVDRALTGHPLAYAEL